MKQSTIMRMVLHIYFVISKNNTEIFYLYFEELNALQVLIYD